MGPDPLAMTPWGAQREQTASSTHEATGYQGQAVQLVLPLAEYPNRHFYANVGARSCLLLALSSVQGPQKKGAHVDLNDRDPFALSAGIVSARSEACRRWR